MATQGTYEPTAYTIVNAQQSLLPPLSMSRLDELESQVPRREGVVLPLELQGYILELALEDESAIDGSFQHYLLHVLCLSKFLSPIVARRLYRNLDTQDKSSQAIKILANALKTSSSKGEAVKRLTFGTVSNHYSKCNIASAEYYDILSIVCHCYPEELLLYLGPSTALLARSLEVSCLQRLVICAAWFADDLQMMSAFGSLLERVAIQSPQARISLAGAPVQALALLEPGLIANTHGLQHLTLLYCELCETYGEIEEQAEGDFDRAREVYTTLFQRHGSRLRYLDIKGLQHHYLQEGNFELSSMGKSHNLETLVISIRFDPTYWYDVVHDLPNIPALKRVVLQESMEVEDFIQPLLLDILEDMLANKKHLPKLEQLDFTTFELRGYIEDLQDDDEPSDLMGWEVGFKRLEGVCSSRKIALVY